MSLDIAVLSGIRAVLTTVATQDDDNLTEDAIAAYSCLVSGDEKTLPLFSMKPPRESHHRPRFYSEFDIGEYSDADYHRLFRMMRDTFDALLRCILDKVPSFETLHISGSFPVPAKKKLQVALFYLASTAPLRAIGDRFNLADSTVMAAKDEVVSILCGLKSKFIKWPTEEEAAALAEEFEEVTGISGIIGAIDGSHFEAKFPKEIANDFINRKFFKSTNVQAVCTHSKLLTHITIGVPGRVHDARVLRLSGISRTIRRRSRNHLFYNEKYHIVGDSAYPLATWCMVPYKRQNLTAAQRKFNRRLSRGRVNIENTFGLIKGRWRRSRYIDVYVRRKINQTLTACCVLHNFCYINNDFIEEYFDYEQPPQPDVNDNDEAEDLEDLTDARYKRDMLKNRL